MPDMLVHLLKLPSLEETLATCRENGVVLRNPLPHELSKVRAFATKHFGVGWADEISAGFARQPVSVVIALREGKIVGFAAYECTCRAFFGPTGVAESERGKGVGKALLIAAMWGLRHMGYAYGIIGGAGPTEFYAKSVGAVPIEGSKPGVYADPIAGEED